MQPETSSLPYDEVLRLAERYSDLPLEALFKEDLLRRGVAGVASRPQVRSVKLSAPPPASGCDRLRDDLVHALGAGWSAGEPSLGAVTATQGATRSARIVCTGAELSLSIVG